MLDPWQVAALDDALGEWGPKWAAFEVGLIVPRQNGKGSILEARELAGLFLFGEQLILHSAHEFKTAAEAFRRLLVLVESTPELDREVLRVRTSHGEEGIELKSGQRIRFVARSTGSGRGFTGDTIILDEAYNLPAKAVAALVPTMSARSMDGNPQIWYTSSAPLPDDSSTTLRALCARGRGGESSRLCYLEFSADPDADLDDQESWAEANPGLGIRISPEFIAEVEREAMDEETFARERLGIWRDYVGEQALPSRHWAACANPEMRLADPVTLAVDVTPDRAWSSIAAAGDTAKRVGVELIEHRKRTSWVVDRLVELTKAHPVAMIVVDPASQAGSLVEAMEEAGLTVTTTDTRAAKAACGLFYDDVVEHAVEHLAQPDLEAAIVGASKRPVGDAWLWNRRGDADITPLVAVTLALWGHRQRGDVDPSANVW